MFSSLIWKDGQKPVIKEKHFIDISNNLDLQKILSVMSKEPYIKMTPEIFLGSIADNTEDIKYRQHILKDFINKENIILNFQKLIKDIDKMEELHKTMKPDFIVPALMLRYKKLELFLSIMSNLENLFENGNASPEFMAIAKTIKETNKKNKLSALKTDLVKISEIVTKTKSIDLGANIDDQNIREAAITAVNSFAYEKTDIIKKISNNDSESYVKNSIATETDIRNEGFLLIFRNEIYEDFESLLKTDIASIENILAKYKDIITSGILEYRNEFCLYFGAIRLAEFIKRNEYKYCFPEFSAEPILNGLYSLHMLYEKSTESGSKKYKVVKNSINIKNRKEILLVTGPNNGGKTVLIQTLGLMQLLFQNGLIVPMSDGVMTVYNHISTHFPKDEDINKGTGRLGEEAARVAEIYREKSGKSMVIFNEPYVTTSPVEGLDILIKSLELFSSGDITVYLVTHYLDIIEKASGRLKFKSYVMEIKNEERTYKALEMLPLGKSYAREMANAIGVDEKGLLKANKEGDIL